MKQYTYNKTGHKVVEKATLKNPKPYTRHPDNEQAVKHYLDSLKEYDTHIFNLTSYPVHGEVDWKDGDVVTGKFEVKKCSDCKIGLPCLHDLTKWLSPCLLAYPIQQEQESEDELWYSLLCLIESSPTFVDRCKQHFQITRRKK